MNLRDLQYIVTLAEKRHFAHAAEACHVSQSTLSAQLKKVEQYLGVVLFDRSHRHAVLTPVGREVVACARAALREVGRINEIAATSKDPMACTLHLGVIPTLGPYFLPHVILSVRRLYPQLRIILHERRTATILDQLRTGGLDLALLALPVPTTGFETRPLFKEEFVVALPKRHPLSKQRSLSPAQISDCKMLLLEEGHCLRDQALEICRTAAAQNEDTQASSLETLRQMVALNVGCTLLPKLAADAVPTKLRNGAIAIRPFRSPAPSRTIAMLWRRQFPRRETLRRLADALEDYLPSGVSAIE